MTKRRFNQKSLVLISNHDFPAFFMNLLRIITSSGAISDPARLEAACSQIEAWPPPSLRKMELPFLGVMVMLEMYVRPLELTSRT